MVAAAGVTEKAEASYWTLLKRIVEKIFVRWPSGVCEDVQREGQGQAVRHNVGEEGGQEMTEEAEMHEEKGGRGGKKRRERGEKRAEKRGCEKSKSMGKNGRVAEAKNDGVCR